MRAVPIAVFVVVLTVAGTSPAQWIHPFDVPQDGNAPGEVWMVVEIPAGSLTKYEIDKRTGLVTVDRIQSMRVSYPANYGAVSSTHADDGDNLDALVYTREPLVPGTMIKVRIVGVLPIRDGGAQDDKLIAVPVSAVDPWYGDVHDAADLPAIERERLEAFFRIYKQLPTGRNVVEVGQMRDRNRAVELLADALDAYRQRRLPDR